MISTKALKKIPKGALVLVLMQGYPFLLARFEACDRQTVTFSVGGKLILLDRRFLVRVDVYPAHIEPEGLEQVFQDTIPFELKKSLENSRKDIQDNNNHIGFAPKVD